MKKNESIKEQNSIKERSSNIELLRIISMIAIIAGHFVSQSGALINVKSDIALPFLYIIGSGHRISVNIFLIIGTWFMVDREFNAKRVVKMYFQVLFYTASITTIMLIAGADTSIKDILRGYLPFFGRALWFASAYITLLLLAPYLKNVFKLEEKSLFKLLCLLFVFISVVSTLPDRQEAYLCDSLWFIFIYLFIGYFKQYKYKQLKSRRWIYLVVGLGLYIILALFRYLFRYNLQLNELVIQYLEDIKTIPNFISAFFIFLFFLNVNIGSNKIINYIARTAFGVYIIHQVPAFIKYLWTNIFKCNQFYDSEYFVMYTIGTILLVYIFASIVDNIRIKFIEPRYVESKTFNKICDKINSFYNIKE